MSHETQENERVPEEGNEGKKRERKERERDREKRERMRKNFLLRRKETKVRD